MWKSQRSYFLPEFYFNNRKVDARQELLSDYVNVKTIKLWLSKDNVKEVLPVVAQCALKM